MGADVDGRSRQASHRFSPWMTLRLAFLSPSHTSPIFHHLFLTYIYKGIKCKSEFCWACLANYDDIRLYGNSKHTKACEYHTDNLPSLPPGIT
jgi:hypothetical protein